MKRKLLIVVNVDWFFVSHRLPIALEAVRQGYEVHIATTLTDEKFMLQSYGLIVHAISINRSEVSMLDTIKTIWQFKRLFRVVKPDIVHLVTIKPVLFGGLVARIIKLPAVVTAVSGLGVVFVSRGVKARIRRFLVGQLYRFALAHSNQIVIFQNPDDVKRLRKFARLPENKINMIQGSGVDISQFRLTPLPTGAPLILFAARLLVEKGVQDFVEAAEILRQRGISTSEARFVIVGKPDPDNPGSIDQEILSRWEDEGVVELWGHRNDLSKIMADSHIVVLPSYYGEGLPKVLIEAAASGRAVVTTDHPGCRDAIVPNQTGMLVPIQNSIALANTLEYLIHHPDVCKRMGECGRKLAEKEFAIEKIVAEHMSIYQIL